MVPMAMTGGFTKQLRKSTISLGGSCMGLLYSRMFQINTLQNKKGWALLHQFTQSIQHTKNNNKKRGFGAKNPATHMQKKKERIEKKCLETLECDLAGTWAEASQNDFPFASDWQT